MRTATKIVFTLGTVGIVGLGLTGCASGSDAFPSGPTITSVTGESISAQDIADVATSTLKGTLGYSPKIDCGNSKDVAVADGETLTCDLYDPQTKMHVSTVITMHQKLNAAPGTYMLSVNLKTD